MEEDRIIPWRPAVRRYLGISPTTAWRRERTDPEFASLKIKIGGSDEEPRYGVRLSELQAYVASRPRGAIAAAPAKALEAKRIGDERRRLERRKASEPV